MPVQAAPPPIPAPQAAPPALPFDDSRVPAATGFSAPAPSTPSAPNPLFAAAVPPPSNLGASPVVLSAPPVGTPAAISAHAAPAGRIEEPPAFRAKRGKGLWIVLLLLLIAAGAAAFFFLRGARKRADVPVPAAKPEATAPIAEAPPPAETEPTTAQSSTAAAEPTASAEPASTDAGASPEPTSPEPAAETPVAPNPPSGVTEPTGSAQAGGGFADLFAAGAKQASVGRFDPKIARASVDRLLSDAARCREPGGPTGYVRVDVTFQPAGTVSNAVVTDAPISGTSTAACISAVFKRATIPEFSGTAGTVTTRISIQ